MPFMETVAFELLVSTICDIIRYAGSKLFGFFKKPGLSLQKTVERELLQNAPEDFSRLFESSTFVSYFNSPQFLDVINAYLEHKIIYRYTAENAKVQKLLYFPSGRAQTLCSPRCGGDASCADVSVAS